MQPANQHCLSRLCSKSQRRVYRDKTAECDREFDGGEHTETECNGNVQ